MFRRIHSSSVELEFACMSEYPRQQHHDRVSHKRGGNELQMCKSMVFSVHQCFSQTSTNITSFRPNMSVHVHDTRFYLPVGFGVIGVDLPKQLLVAIQTSAHAPNRGYAGYTSFHPNMSVYVSPKLE